MSMGEAWEAHRKQRLHIPGLPHSKPTRGPERDALKWLPGPSSPGGLTEAKRKCAAFSVTALRKGSGYSESPCAGRH